MRIRKPVICAIIILGLICVSCSKPQTNNVKSPGVFGQLADGREIHIYTISNAGGMSAQIINYGAIVVSLKTPDRSGGMNDVILGFDNLDGYVNDKSFQGAIVGRYGNRIGKGKFSLDGREYQLTINDGFNHLHGGKTGFFKAVWRAEQVNGSTLRLSLESPDGDEGYPGNVKIVVIYTVTDDNALRIDYRGTTDSPTILNPTNHCYFNLTGSPQNSILEHELTIAADYFTPVDNQLIPTGEIREVAGTPMDFRTIKVVGRDINTEYEQLLFGKGFDHNWVLNGYKGEVHPVATLYDPMSGRIMDVLTDQPGLQVYSGNFLDGSIIGKCGIPYNYRTALCLETQAFPDTPNKPNFPSVVLRPGEEFKRTTTYRFSTK